jgi:AcrR family transcriptional regulator
VQALLVATERLLDREGFARATTNRIAELAGTSIGSLYQYFASKDALVAALVDRRIEEQVELLRVRLAELEALPLEVAFESFARDLVDLYARRPRVDSALLSLLALVGKREKMVQAEREATTHLAAHLRARALPFAPDELERVAFVLVHSFQGVVAAACAHEPDQLQNADFRASLARELGSLAMGYVSRRARM